jgi:multiple sugar transport system substrate-binding protein
VRTQGDQQSSISRRQFLRLAATAIGVTAVVPLLSACGSAPATAPAATSGSGAAATTAPAAVAPTTAAPAAAPTTAAAEAAPTTAAAEAAPTTAPAEVATAGPGVAPTTEAAAQAGTYTEADVREGEAAFNAAPKGNPDPAWAGKKITVGTPGGGLQGLSGTFYFWRPYFEKLTGATYDVAEIPFPELSTKYNTDLATGTGAYDIMITGDWFYGDYISGDFLLPLDDYYNDARMPKTDRAGFPPIIADKSQWGGKWYGMPYDTDGHVLFYRRDILEDTKWQTEFKSETGMDMPVPPRTWEEVIEVAKFFNGKDWNGDGEPDHGISMHLKVGDQGFFHYFTFSAAYSVMPGPVDRYHGQYWFDPETMEPLINSKGHVRAMEQMIALSKLGSPEIPGWSLGEGWNDFWVGKSPMIFSWGDVGSGAERQPASVIKGKLGAVAIPGTLEVYDRQTDAFVKMDKPNFVANTTGASWHAVLSKFSKEPDLAFYLMALIGTPSINLWCIQRGWAGVDIGPKYSMLPPYGDAKPEDYTNNGFDPKDIEYYSKAYGDMLFSPEYKTFIPQLRVPGAWEYWMAEDANQAEAVTGAKTAQQALDDTAADWARITEDRGLESQLKWYQQSIGYKPA